METRNELVLKFMLAVASGENTTDVDMTPEEHADYVFQYAEALVDRYHETLR